MRYIISSCKLKDIPMKNTIKKMAGLFFIAMAMTSCAKNENKAEDGLGECSYEITIDGKTTTANRFGQDWMTFTSESYEGDAGFSLRSEERRVGKECRWR